MTSSSPSVSVIIPHRGEDAPLERCLQGLRHQSYSHDRYEVLVVLNESEQRTLACELLGDEVMLWEPHYFSYNARNHGIEKSTGDIIAFTDSDTVPSSDWIAEGVNALKRTDSDLVAGHITVTTTRARATAPALYELLFAFDQEKNVGRGFSTTANLFAARDTFERCGLFEKTALTGEDFDWTRAAVESGAKLTYARSAIVDHSARETWSALLAKARRTTLPYVNLSQTDPDSSNRLRTRFRFQLGAKPSAEKVAALPSHQRVMARLARFVVVAYKALCLLRFSPAFRRDLHSAQAREATHSITGQGATA